MSKNPKTGDILTTGGWTNNRWWVVESAKNGWVTLTDLKWSADMLKEAGCFRRGTETIRRKLGRTGVLYDSNPATRYGSFSPWTEESKILPTPPAS